MDGIDAFDGSTSQDGSFDGSSIDGSSLVSSQFAFESSAEISVVVGPQSAAVGHGRADFSSFSAAARGWASRAPEYASPSL